MDDRVGRAPVPPSSRLPVDGKVDGKVACTAFFVLGLLGS